MAALHREQIDGKWATIAYLSDIDGDVVDSDDAKIAVVRFDDGSKVIYFVQSIAPKDTK